MADDQNERQDLRNMMLDDDSEQPSNWFCSAGINHMYSVLSSVFWKKPKLNPEVEDPWEISFESIVLHEYIGAGAYANVYSAWHNGELVAFKMVNDKKELDMKYLRELKHPNIVRFRGVCMEPTRYGIVMEFCQYGSLFSYIHGGSRIVTTKVVKWANEIASAMQYLHKNKIIHRDLKSPNVLIADDLVAKVTDFGLSRMWDKFSVVMTYTGTISWMAPELILRKRASDRIDVWSYGIVLWELLTQKVPYDGLSTCAVTFGVGSEKLSLPLPDTFPEHLRILITHCWHRDPRDRPTFDNIVEALPAALHELSIMSDDRFNVLQNNWMHEVDEHKRNGWLAAAHERVEQAPVQKSAKKQKMLNRMIERDAKKIYMESCAVRLLLEQREVDIAKREKAFNRMIPRSVLNNRRRSFSSSSSDSVPKPTLVKLRSDTNKAATITELATNPPLQTTEAMDDVNGNVGTDTCQGIVNDNYIEHAIAV
ncbi:mitogen-activated protein kinase kinase kinase 12-like [Galleria mellonella]|uniref:Mitogen-activated protein kinase kinase kinase 12-like n=1 Tax=Galleria mellonella TaxID=7137 RepID=A0A6J1X774_GALME|nr:mitogen-activated protein kinase kinase kinase 12-like [Galleria mellonella]XP_031767585.1 mitogen-activated protein kinase kinase kinase 12-like [Galleria mellonella]